MIQNLSGYNFFYFFVLTNKHFWSININLNGKIYC